jgi:D-sedoheptulose 7-phosphate isomerase
MNIGRNKLNLESIGVIVEHAEGAVLDSKLYFNKIQSLILEQVLKLSLVVDIIHECILRKNSIWIMGNGGSASTAEHFETDLHFIKHGEKIRIGAQSLTSNSSLITAIGNDIGFEEVFRHQLMRKSKKKDLVILISASGNSQNLINAAMFAKENDLETIALLGFDGGKLLDLVDHHILIKSEIGMYGPVEDIHLAICHAIASELLDKLK